MKSLFRLIVLLVMAFAIQLQGAKYEKVTIAIPTTAFEQSYPLEYDVQLLRSGTSYPHAGSTKESYFIRYTFNDKKEHLVHVPKSNNGLKLTKRNADQIEVINSFKYKFTKGSILFDPKKQYTVLTKKDAHLLLRLDQNVGDMEVPADRFKCHKMLLEKRPTEAQSSSHTNKRLIETPQRLKAYLDATPPPETLEAVKHSVDGICLIEKDEGKGTGFLFSMEGRVYCITNHHVLGNAVNLKISTSDGRSFTPLYSEVAEDRDLARILLKETPPSYQTVATSKLNESVRILGNSGGVGVVTFAKGKVIGHSPKVIEVDADFIEGNSGSPVLNDDNEVIGVATFVRAAEDGQDNWVAEKTRFAKARRFAVQITDDITWVQIPPKQLNTSETLIQQHSTFIHTATELILLFTTNPTSNIPDKVTPSLRLWVRQTNLLNKKLNAEVLNFNLTTQEAYHTDLKRIAKARADGFILQTRNLTNLIKRQKSKLQNDKRSIPSVGYYTKTTENLDLQYAYLIDGLVYVSKYFSDSAPKL